MHSLILKWEKAEREKVLAGYTCLQIIEGLWQESTIRIVIFYSIAVIQSKNNYYQQCKNDKETELDLMVTKQNSNRHTRVPLSVFPTSGNGHRRTSGCLSQKLGLPHPWFLALPHSQLPFRYHILLILTAQIFPKLILSFPLAVSVSQFRSPSYSPSFHHQPPNWSLFFRPCLFFFHFPHRSKHVTLQLKTPQWFQFAK